MRQLALIFILASCRQRAPAPPPEIVVVEEEQQPASAPAVAPVPNTVVNENAAGMRISVLHNGRPLPPGTSCHFAVYDEAGSDSAIAQSECGKSVTFPAGDRSVRVTLHIGQSTRSFALSSEPIEGGRDEVIEAKTDFARLRIRHSAAQSPGVSRCSVALTENGNAVVSGPDDQYYDVFAGDYDATLICDADDGIRSPTIRNIEVKANEERDVQVGVLPLQTEAASQPEEQPSPLISLPAQIIPRPVAPPAAMYFVPGQPMPQAGEPSAPPDYGHADDSANVHP